MSICGMMMIMGCTDPLVVFEINVERHEVSFFAPPERIQSDPTAFIMLGYLNEHLQLKRQALQAYQRWITLTD